MLELIRWYLSGATLRIVLAVVAGLVSGAFGAALIAVIGQGLSTGSANRAFITAGFLWSAAGFVVLAVGSELLTRWLHLHVNLHQYNGMRDQLVVRLVGTELATIERIGAARIYATLVDDVRTIMIALGGLPTIAISCAVVAGSLLYLLWLSPLALGILVALVLPSMGLLLFLNRKGRDHFREFLAQRDKQIGYFVSVTEGIRELKLSIAKQRAFLDDRIRPTAELGRRSQLASSMFFAASASWIQLTYTLAILVVFILVASQWIPHEILASYALTTVFMKEHVGRLVNAYPAWAQAVTAKRNVDALELLPNDQARAAIEAEAAPWADMPLAIELVDVRYRYKGAALGDEFELGPISCSMHSGEVVFIVGENGGGKSTFAKLLSGLYQPDSGRIALGGQPLTGSSQPYRELFSVVWTDSFVFDELPASVQPSDSAKVANLLARLELDDQVTIADRTLSTTQLSHGQRKRLALLHAILEDRPIYLLDEWAATQDPRFKKFFYREILPGLKARGKLVIVITHDVEFSDCADRVLKMDQGMLSVSRAAA